MVLKCLDIMDTNMDIMEPKENMATPITIKK
jgi:hypothetical protein